MIHAETETTATVKEAHRFVLAAISQGTQTSTLSHEAVERIARLATLLKETLKPG